jgi:pyruvate dehydrogenase E1 component alpha subunit
MYDATVGAVARARRREGPTLFECLTYRWRGHVGPSFDIEHNLRTQEELDSWIARCPIQRLAHTLDSSGQLSPAERAQVDAVIEEEVHDAISFARESPFPVVGDLLEHVYKT